jgi:hypothetical protein
VKKATGSGALAARPNSASHRPARVGEGGTVSTGPTSSPKNSTSDADGIVALPPSSMRNPGSPGTGRKLSSRDPASRGATWNPVTSAAAPDSSSSLRRVSPEFMLGR